MLDLLNCHQIKKSEIYNKNKLSISSNVYDYYRDNLGIDWEAGFFDRFLRYSDYRILKDIVSKQYRILQKYYHPDSGHVQNDKISKLLEQSYDCFLTEIESKEVLDEIYSKFNNYEKFFLTLYKYASSTDMSRLFNETKQGRVDRKAIILSQIQQRDIFLKHERLLSVLFDICTPIDCDNYIHVRYPYNVSIDINNFDEKGHGFEVYNNDGFYKVFLSSRRFRCDAKQGGLFDVCSPNLIIYDKGELLKYMNGVNEMYHVSLSLLDKSSNNYQTQVQNLRDGALKLCKDFAKKNQFNTTIIDNIQYKALNKFGISDADVLDTIIRRIKTSSFARVNGYDKCEGLSDVRIIGFINLATSNSEVKGLLGKLITKKELILALDNYQPTIDMSCQSNTIGVIISSKSFNFDGENHYKILRIYRASKGNTQIIITNTERKNINQIENPTSQNHSSSSSTNSKNHRLYLFVDDNPLRTLGLYSKASKMPLEIFDKFIEARYKILMKHYKNYLESLPQDDIEKRNAVYNALRLIKASYNQVRNDSLNYRAHLIVNAKDIEELYTLNCGDMLRDNNNIQNQILNYILTIDSECHVYNMRNVNIQVVPLESYGRFIMFSPSISTTFSADKRGSIKQTNFLIQKTKKNAIKRVRLSATKNNDDINSKGQTPKVEQEEKIIVGAIPLSELGKFGDVKKDINGAIRGFLASIDVNSEDNGIFAIQGDKAPLSVEEARTLGKMVPISCSSQLIEKLSPKIEKGSILVSYAPYIYDGHFYNHAFFIEGIIDDVVFKNSDSKNKI